ncbi:phosphodiesterase [Sulfolobus sp. E3]|nr:phosphodiesterase [Sulfolobus sp. E3]
MIIPNLDKSLLSLSVEIKNNFEDKTTEMITRKKLIFILVDGLGYDLAKRVLSKRLPDYVNINKIHSVFPTITITVLSTLFTATPPGVHGIMGWKIFDKRRGRIIDLLKEKSYKINLESYLPKESVILTSYEENVLRFTKMVSGERMIIPYYSPWDAFTQAYNLAQNDSPFIFLYLPYVDMVSHHLGPYSEHTIRVAREVMDLTFKLANDVKEKYDVIVTADHGHVPVKGYVRVSEEILKIVDFPPFGGARNLMFISKRNPKEWLEENYDMAIFDKEKLKNICGGDNVPDFAGVPLSNMVYDYWDDEEEKTYLGSHGGLSKEEIEIPLIVVGVCC